jgi:hypothetical protein
MCTAALFADRQSCGEGVGVFRIHLCAVLESHGFTNLENPVHNV